MHNATTPARFWVLAAFSLAAIAGGAAWNVFSPVSSTAFRAYGWDDAFISWAANSANITFFLALWPASRAVSFLGVRRLTVCCSAMVLIAALLRVAADPRYVGSLPHGVETTHVLAMLLVGLGGPWFNFGGVIISELWFPQKERTVATAVASVASFSGIALGFLIGPTIVSVAGDSEKASRDEARASMFALFLFEAGLAAVALCGVWVYFPDAPQTPPSEAAALRRGAKETQRKKDRMRVAEGGGGGAQPLSAVLQLQEEAVMSATTEYIALSGGETSSSSSSSSTAASAVDGIGALLSCRRCWRRQTKTSSPSFTPELRRFWILALVCGLPIGMYVTTPAHMYLLFLTIPLPSSPLPPPPPSVTKHGAVCFI